MKLAAVVLAAGKGTRMKSKYPKVLHRICGCPMLDYVLEAVSAAGADVVVVVAGYGYDQVAKEVGARGEVVLQAEQLGTGHALLQAAPVLRDFKGQVLVVCGDTPLVRGETLSSLVSFHREGNYAATVLTAVLDDPFGYGRVVRDGRGNILKIVEQKDASGEEKQIKEINTGMYCFESAGLFDALAELSPANTQGEYYLTDVIERYVQEGREVAAFTVDDPLEVYGINDRLQLARAESIMRQRVLEELMRCGVTVVDPASTFVDRRAVIGADTVIYPFSIIEGTTTVGEDCRIGPSARLVGAVLGRGVCVQNSVIVESTIGDECSIGPFAYLRPGTVLGRGVKVGDFVEIKNSSIGDGSKVPHLSYVGDARVGADVNIGCGTITCNYDGRRKWPTIIGDGAFIGSNTNLVAPVEVGPGAFVGAGSTITKNVPAGALAVERAPQKVILDWAAKKNKE